MFAPSHLSDAPPAVHKDAKAAAKAEASSDKLAKSAAVAAASGGIAAAFPVYGWIIGACAEATALSLTVASKMSGRNAKILAGDESAIAGFLKRISKMKADKRAKLAERLKKELLQHEKHPKKNNAWKVRDNALRLKLGALYAAQHHAEAHPHTALDPLGPTPAEVEASSDNTYLLLGAIGLGLVGVGGYAYTHRKEKK